MSTKRKTKTSHTGTLTSEQAYNNVTDMANDIRSILKSIVSQDGKYTTREAGVAGKLYGAELQRMKMNLEVYKINTKLSSKQSKAEDILSLD